MKQVEIFFFDFWFKLMFENGGFFGIVEMGCRVYFCIYKLIYKVDNLILDRSFDYSSVLVYGSNLRSFFLSRY